ncbi:hypothetical protein ACVIGB_000031 [Bradyrhizobium sp. USDA 4341]
MAPGQLYQPAGPSVSSSHRMLEIEMDVTTSHGALAAFTTSMSLAVIAGLLALSALALMRYSRGQNELDCYLLGGASGGEPAPEATKLDGLLRSLFGGHILARRIGASALTRGIQFVDKVDAEGGRLEIVIQRAASLGDALTGTTARARAIRCFTERGIWNTEDRTGILILVTVASCSVEIVADRTLAGGHDTERFAALAREMCRTFREGDFDDGLTLAASECLHIIRSRMRAPDLQSRPLPRRLDLGVAGQLLPEAAA